MKNQQLTWTLEVKEDPDTGELLLEFPSDFLEMQNWKEGDTLVWLDNGDGSWTLSKS